MQGKRNSLKVKPIGVFFFQVNVCVPLLALSFCKALLPHKCYLVRTQYSVWGLISRSAVLGLEVRTNILTDFILELGIYSEWLGLG